MNTKPTRPSRARKPKAGNLGPKAQAVADTAPNDEAVRSVIATLAASYDADLAQAVADERARWVRSVSPDDLRAKLDETAGFRQRLAAEIDRISTSLAEHQRALIGCDGALQVLGQLIEAVEAKSKEGEA